MTAGTPDFTDFLFADAHMIYQARKGLALSEAGNRRAARECYKQALHWEREAKRLRREVRRLSLMRLREST